MYYIPDSALFQAVVALIALISIGLCQYGTACNNAAFMKWRGWGDGGEKVFSPDPKWGHGKFGFGE